MFYVYVIQDQQGRFYVGQTSDVEERLRRHNEGRSRYTKGAQWKLVHLEEFQTRSESVRREREIKGWKSRLKIEELIAIHTSESG